jgi:NADPH2:quinone reductase
MGYSIATMKAIRIHQHGGPEVLRYEDIQAPEPGPGEALVEIHVSGVNFVDTYVRSGLYKPPSIPFTPGAEGAGIVAKVGTGVTNVRVGDRVGYATSMGSYAEFAAVPSWKLAVLPASVDFSAGAAIMLQGMTAHYLTTSTFPLKAGQVALVHAGAGGVGLLLIQIAKMIGARVIATAGTAAKADLARGAGADETIVYSSQDFEAEVKRMTNGAGVDVVYDAVGAATWEKSLNSLKPRGYLVLYGNASGPVPPFDPLVLMKASLFVTRPTLVHYAANGEDVRWRSGDLLAWLAAGKLKLKYDHVFPLAEAARAQTELEARRTTGKVLLQVKS